MLNYKNKTIRILVNYIVLFAFSISVIFSLFLFSPSISAQEPSTGLLSDFGLTANGDTLNLGRDDFTLRWIDAGTIELRFNSAPDNPIIFTPNNSIFSSSTGRFDRDGGYNVEYRAKNFGCYSFIGFDTNENANREEKLANQLTSARLDIDFRPSSTAECVNYDQGEYNDVSLQNPELSTAYFVWVDEGTIEIADGSGPGSFTRVDPDSNIFIRDSEATESECRDKLILNPSNNTVVWFELDSSYSEDPPASAEAGSCKYNDESIPSSNVSWAVARTDQATLEAGTGIGASATSGSSEDQPNCTNGGGELSWIVCPLLGYADDVISYLDRQINTLLQVPEDYYNDSTIEQIWQRMRDLAYLLLIPTLLIMVIGTALGFQFLDAYTVKRALPRLFVAVIFIAISLPVLRILIGSINIIGQGVYGLITSVVSPGFEFSLEGLFDPNFTTGGLTVLALGGAAITAKVWIVAGLFLAFSVFLSIATIFLLLAFRQLLIVALIIIAPLAILAWIFPGNDKPWKLWWGTFWKLLILYPLIMGLLAIGRVFAYVVDGVSPGGLVEVVLKLVAYIGPFFLVPSAFKYAGGVFANIGGIVNDKEKGVFDRLKKARGQSLAQRNQDRKNFGLYSDNNRIGKGLNTITGAATRPRALMKGRKGINEARSTGQTIGGQEALKNDAVFNANQNDDNFLIALANRDLAKRKLDDARKDLAKATTKEEADSAQAEINAREKGLAAADQVKTKNSDGTRRAALNAWMKTGYNISGGKQGYDEIAETADSIAGGDMRARSAIMDEAQYHAKSAGHAQLGGINHGAGYDPLGGIKKAGLYGLANGKKEAIEAWGEEIMSNAGPPDAQAAIHYQELQALKSNTTGANRDEVTKQMEALEKRGIKQYMSLPSGRIDPSTGAPAVKKSAVKFDSTLAQTDATYAASFTVAEQRQGYREVSTPETRGDVAARESRQYQQPDPNNM